MDPTPVVSGDPVLAVFFIALVVYTAREIWRNAR